MSNFFSSRSKEMQTDIDNYLDNVENAALIFFEGVKNYIAGKIERFEKHYQKITEIETEADRLRRDIKKKLYTFMLIPESRGDVLGLIENIDDVVDIAQKVLTQLSIETPKIPDFLKADFYDLAELSSKSVEELVKAARAFFTEIKLVSNYINKVHFYEHEADQLEEQMKRKIFRTTEIKSFSKRVHLRYFVEKIVLCSDAAESVAERLAVYTIKRRI